MRSIGRGVFRFRLRTMFVAMLLATLCTFGVREHLRCRQLQAENEALRLKNYALDTVMKMQREPPMMYPDHRRSFDVPRFR